MLENFHLSGVDMGLVEEDKRAYKTRVDSNLESKYNIWFVCTWLIVGVWLTTLTCQVL